MSDRAWHFLTQKPWTPWNKETQRRVYVAEQVRKNEEKIIQERLEIKKKENDNEESSKLLQLRKQHNLVTDKESIQGNKAHPLNFMYSAPPGLLSNTEGVQEEPDDVQEFRQQYTQATRSSSSGTMGSTNERRIYDTKLVHHPYPSSSSIIIPTDNVPPSTTNPPITTTTTKYTTIPPTSSTTVLEKEAGKKRAPTLSTAELKHRFPFLKNAPMEVFASNLQVSFHPLGKEIKNVRCLKCHQWGHDTGSKECSLFNVLRPQDEARLQKEDPLTMMQNILQDYSNDDDDNKEDDAKDSYGKRSTSSNNRIIPPSVPNRATAIPSQGISTSINGISRTNNNGGVHLHPSSSSSSSSSLSLLKLKPSAIASLDTMHNSNITHTGRGKSSANYSYVPSTITETESYEAAQQRLQFRLETEAAAAQAIRDDGWGGIGIIHSSNDDNGDDKPVKGRFITSTTDDKNEEDYLYQSLTETEKQRILLLSSSDGSSGITTTTSTTIMSSHGSNVQLPAVNYPSVDQKYSASSYRKRSLSQTSSQSSSPLREDKHQLSSSKTTSKSRHHHRHRHHQTDDDQRRHHHHHHHRKSHRYDHEKKENV